MGIYDREYYRGGEFRASSLQVRTAVGWLILVNVVVFILQWPFPQLNPHLACSASDLFEGFPHVWKLVTACFAHGSPLHILFNMLLLFFLGREIERIYGKTDFFIIYFVSGALSIFCEAAVHQLRGASIDVSILGASGAVMAVVVLFATFYPHRTVLLFFVIPMPMWLLCTIVIVMDFLGVLGSGDNTVGAQTAHWAHLAGVAFAFLYRLWDLRWENVRRRLPGGRRPGRRRVRKRQEKTPPQRSRPDHVSRRIDVLLAKIHDEGMGSLTDEEREFLLENSKKYKGG